MLTLDASAPIQLIDGEYIVIETRNPYVRLRRTADGATVDMHLTELQRKQVGVGTSPSCEPRTFDRLTSSDSTRTMQWVSHIQELVTGCQPGQLSPQLRYDPSCTTLNERVSSKTAELKALGFSASRATIMRKIKAYREQGMAGVIDRRIIRHDGPLDHLNEDVRDALCTVIAAQTFRSTGTKSRLIIETHAELLRRFGSDAPALPATSSMYRYIDALTQGKHTTGSAKTRRSLANRPSRAFGYTARTLPGAEVQVDSTPMDILVLTPSGKVERPTLTIMLDVATRSLLASTIRLEATKGIDHVLLLAQALTPAANRPDSTAYRRMIQDTTPQAVFLDAGERSALEMTRPFIYPRRIMMDNGRDYVSNVFLAAAEKFGIDVTFSAPRTPTDKAHVERMFSSINSLFTQRLPGYLGRSPEFRGEEVEKENLLSVHALYELFDDWTLNVWQNRPHDGLRDRVEPSVRLSPNQVYASASELTSTLHLPLSPDLYVSLLPSAYRTIKSTGVAYRSRIYDSAELNALRNTKSKDPGKKGKWEVKVDPYRPLVVWVRSPKDAWIECRARDTDSHLESHAADVNSTYLPSDRSVVAAVNAARTGTPAHDIDADIPELQTRQTTFDVSDADGSEFDTFDPDKD